MSYSDNEFLVDSRHLLFTTPQRETPIGDKQVSTNQDLMRFNATYSFLSPSTRGLHESLEKAKQQSTKTYNTTNLKLVRKNIIESLDHMLSHNLVRENHNISRYVGIIERQIQSIKEDFNKDILSVLGKKIGEDNELCFPAFKNKSIKNIEKRYKGYSG